MDEIEGKKAQNKGASLLLVDRTDSSRHYQDWNTLPTTPSLWISPCIMLEICKGTIMNHTPIGESTGQVNNYMINCKILCSTILRLSMVDIAYWYHHALLLTFHSWNIIIDTEEIADDCIQGLTFNGGEQWHASGSTFQLWQTQNQWIKEPEHGIFCPANFHLYSM